MLQSAGKKRLNGKGRNDYATHSDFCAIFLQHLDRLYLLALILTRDEPSAEKCLLAAFDLCAEESLVFKESAVGWSRRSVIKNAIRLMSPVPTTPARPLFPDNDNNLNLDQDASLNHVQQLPRFDRFVFVMSVLERYSDRECALLLGCSFTDILPARIRALQQISRIEKSYSVYRSAVPSYVVDADWLECG
jgi:hypothetical protein